MALTHLLLIGAAQLLAFFTGSGIISPGIN
jgi:hypothetical protein